MKLARVVALVTTMIAAGQSLSCGGSPTAPPPPTKAVIVLTISPNPIFATSSPPGWDIAFQWTFRETAGVGGTLTLQRLQVVEKATGRTVGDLQATGVDYSFAPLSTTVVSREPLFNHLHYVPSTEQRGATLVITYRIADRLGNLSTDSASADIQ